MAEYEIQFGRSAAREFRALPTDVKRRVAAAIELLRQAPRPDGVRKLRGNDRRYRIRIGHYRVVYDIDDQSQQLLITEVRHRRDAYR